MLSLQSCPPKGVSLGYVGRNFNLKDLEDCRKAPEHQSTKAQKHKSTEAAKHQKTGKRVVRQDAGSFRGSFLRKGELLAYVGRNRNFKDPNWETLGKGEGGGAITVQARNESGARV